ncbi:MAG: hypothetical protein AAGH68_12780 [Pseudomonadota bacterium]
MIRALISLAFLMGCLAPHPADARPWTLADLGRVPLERHCMMAAGRAFQSLLATHPIDALYQTDWAIHADGITGGHDAVITCTHGNARGTRATLIVHSRGEARAVRFLSKRLIALYEDHSARVISDWKNSFN